ncbi:potassium channel family protein [Paractinoplanes rishiriensis]|uniref:NAD-binding protein of Kef-type K+ transporter n=1 Tax=Paractinoplanes rishiriensis TaxID=1050105 RepID=A0A919K9M8_9ACTN|nr:potassium channel family protein [Actinoplanes rishiriensis]GIF01263.1 NAD-binding protein of Kef-type K+ transporter [Actinoplanes rishiriensis]
MSDGAEHDEGVVLPLRQSGPLRSIATRLGLAVATLAVMTTVVLVDSEGYNDVRDRHVSALDAVYYATVTLSTTGYGDVVPVSDRARLANVLVVMPLRVFFLVLLVSTTFEVLTRRTRRQWQVKRWRAQLRGHTVVIGYGNKGRAAVRALREGADGPIQFVVVDASPYAAQEAADDGHAAIVGDATRGLILDKAGVRKADRIIVAADRDDTASLVTLSVRELNAVAVIAVAVRASENVPLLKRSGATTVITSSEAAGRLLGLSAQSPAAGHVIGDLLVQREGLRLVDRAVHEDEVGRSPAECEDLIVAVIRKGQLLRYDKIGALAFGDRVILVHVQS